MRIEVSLRTQNSHTAIILVAFFWHRILCSCLNLVVYFASYIVHQWTFGYVDDSASQSHWTQYTIIILTITLTYICGRLSPICVIKSGLRAQTCEDHIEGCWGLVIVDGFNFEAETQVRVIGSEIIHVNWDCRLRWDIYHGINHI
jgi:hypothetical protein